MDKRHQRGFVMREKNMEVAGAYKTCPRCGERLFQDMGTCYGCLYEFKGVGVPMLDLDEPDCLVEKGEAVGPDCRDDEACFDDEAPLEGEAPPYEDVAADEVPPPPGSSRWVIRVKTALSETRLPVAADGLLIGKAPDCEVVLHQRSVSDRHLRLAPGPEGIDFQDLGSTNPATVGGKPLVDAACLGEGAVLELCGTILEVERAP